jgi:hypothetical protein
MILGWIQSPGKKLFFVEQKGGISKEDSRGVAG